MEQIVLVDIADGIASVRLNRPTKKNALTTAMFDAISEAGESLKSVEGLRAVVLSGEGGCFCAGLDTSNFMEMAGNIDALREKLVNPPKGEMANFFQKPCYVWQELNVPVIAAVEGVAFGGGAQLALAADFRIMAPDAKFSIMESRWGIIPDMGISQSLPKLLAADKAKELMMTARIIDGTEALALGLTTRIDKNPIAVAHAFAAELAARSPEAVNGIKELVERTWGRDPDGLAVEAQLQAPIIGASNQIEAVMAALQKRPATYK